MTRAEPLSLPAAALTALYVGIGISPLFFTPAYQGYLISYSLFILASAHLLFLRRQGQPAHGLLPILWALSLVFIFANTAILHNNRRDVFRDCGAIISFLFGFYVIPRGLGDNWEKSLFSGLSALSIIVSISTVFGAARAYISGASAYEWRGDYILFFQTWLPYLLAVEYVRSQDGAPFSASAARIGLCCLAILLSLSRTSLALLIFFGVFLFASRFRSWFFTRRGLGAVAVLTAVCVFVIPRLLDLQVVQQRIDAGIGEGDLSVAWRFMEIRAAKDYLNLGGWFTWLFGYGLGSRVPLPFGIVDFDGNVTIPQLHNSFWTIIVKTGLVGLTWVLSNLARLFLRAQLNRGGAPALYVGGSWILLFVLGTAFTLQGMSEWGHLTFLGVACAMLRKAGSERPWPGTEAPFTNFGRRRLALGSPAKTTEAAAHPRRWPDG